MHRMAEEGEQRSIDTLNVKTREKEGKEEFNEKASCVKWLKSVFKKMQLIFWFNESDDDLTTVKVFKCGLNWLCARIRTMNFVFKRKAVCLRKERETIRLKTKLDAKPNWKRNRNCAITITTNETLH